MRILTAIGVLAPFLALSAGTGSTTVNTYAAHSVALKTLRVGYIPITGLIGMYAGIERGFFRQEGVSLSLTPMAGAAVMLPAMQGGSLDLGVSNPVTTLVAASQGLQPVEVAHGEFDDRAHPTNGVLVMADSPIRSAKDLEGKTVAVNTLNGVAQIGFEQWMKDHGGDPSKARFLEVTFPQMLADLTHHQIDAAVEAEPFIAISKSMGTRILAHHFTEERRQTLVGGFMALRPWAKAHPTLLRAFSTAYNRGQTWADKHPTQARKYLTKYVQMDAALAQSVNLQTIRGIRPADLAYWMRLALRWHVLTRSENVKKLVWSTAR